MRGTGARDAFKRVLVCRMKTKISALLLLASMASVTVHVWGVQGRRLVALVATNHLTPVARQNVTWLLGEESLADISSWAKSVPTETRLSVPVRVAVATA